ncbi:unnamed protein product, partial [Symbiodinium microadriaticum]
MMERPATSLQSLPSVSGSAWTSSAAGSFVPAPVPLQQHFSQQPPYAGPFSDPNLTLQEIADKANALQQQIDENAGRQKAELRSAMEARHREVEQHAQSILRHAVQSIEARKASQLQLIERQRAQEEAATRQDASEAKKLIDLEMQKALAALGVSHTHQWMGPTTVTPGLSLDPKHDGEICPLHFDSYLQGFFSVTGNFLKRWRQDDCAAQGSLSVPAPKFHESGWNEPTVGLSLSDGQRAEKRLAELTAYCHRSRNGASMSASTGNAFSGLTADTNGGHVVPEQCAELQLLSVAKLALRVGKSNSKGAREGTLFKIEIDQHAAANSVGAAAFKTHQKRQSAESRIGRHRQIFQSQIDSFAALQARAPGRLEAQHLPTDVLHGAQEPAKHKFGLRQEQLCSAALDPELHLQGFLLAIGATALPIIETQRTDAGRDALFKFRHFVKSFLHAEPSVAGMKRQSLAASLTRNLLPTGFLRRLTTRSGCRLFGMLPTSEEEFLPTASLAQTTGGRIARTGTSSLNAGGLSDKRFDGVRE